MDVNKKRAAQKKEIIEATILLAEKEGWQGVSTRKIAKKIGYSTIVVYDCFGSKNNLLMEIQNYGFKKIMSLFKSNLNSQLTAREEIIVMSNSIWDFAESEPQLFKLMFGFSGLVDQCDQESFASGVAQFIRTKLGKIFKEEDMRSVFTNWWALIQGFIIIKLTYNNLNEIIKVYFDDAIRRFLGQI